MPGSTAHDSDAAETPPASGERLASHIAFVTQYPPLYRRLRAAESVAHLFAMGAELTRETCGFGRALVLTVDGDELTAGSTAVLVDPDSDRLRRRVLAAPLAIEANTHESDLIRGSHRQLGPSASRPSVLAEVLELEHFAVGTIAPEGRPLALLVADRPPRPVDDLDRAAVAGMAAMIGMALEHVVMQARLAEVSTELNHLTLSAQALMQEVLHSPLSIPTDRGTGYAFARPYVGRVNTDLRARLTEREEEVAALLVDGRSNLEIAATLMLSPETVKTYVARLRRKLNASNRVEAASLYLRMLQSESRAPDGEPPTAARAYARAG